MEKLGNNVIVFVDDKTLNLGNNMIDDKCIIRYGARGIVLNSNNEIAIFNKQGKNEYKLPGGGLEANETPQQAFLREVLEETGCDVEIIDYLGLSIEEKGRNNFKQISYIFVARVINDTKCLHLTLKEKNEDSRIMWLSIDEALNVVTECITNLKGSVYDSLYSSLFMVKRDSLILDYYKNKYQVKKMSNK